MAITYENVIPSPVDNTTVRKLLRDGTHIQFTIQANSGYVLHDKENDGHILDPETGELVFTLAYTRGVCSERYDYDWDTNEREFYCILESEVPDPENQIVGDTPDHETA